MYTKPHLTLEQQLERLKQRGLVIDDPSRALAVIGSVGYYRMSAYVYPFREMLPAARQGSSSPTSFRGEQIEAGTTFAQIEALWSFDRQLRLICLDGLERLEVALRTRAAYILGRRDPFGHTDPRSLDARKCERVRSGSHGKSDFDLWKDRYAKQIVDSRHEDFVQHLQHKYGHPLPVWAAVECLDFGSLQRLLSFLKGSDANELAELFSIGSGQLLVDVTLRMNSLRNTCAHHGRLWNRVFPYRLAVFDVAHVGAGIRHAANIPNRDRVYLLLAWLAYVVGGLDPSLQLAPRLRDHALTLRPSTGKSLQHSMGFPADWERLTLWQ